MTEAEKVEKTTPIIPMTRSDFLSVLALGAAVGLVVWGLGMVFHRFIFDVYFCQGEVVRQCSNARNYSVAVASFIGGIAALAGLIRLRVYRPLLVLIASVISTWGLVQLSWDLGWFTGLLVVAVMYALAFAAFSWLARVREFWLSLVLIIILVVAVRLVMTS